MMRDGRILVVRACVAAILVAFLSTWVPRAEGGQSKQVTVAGKVLNAGGRPVEGARVRLYQERYAGVPYEAEMALTGDITVGPDGTYAFRVPAETDAYRYGYLFAEKAGLAIGFASGAVTQDRTFDLTLGEPTPLAGVIVDEDGGPVPDASVGIYILRMGQGAEAYGLSMHLASKLLTTRTDASGRFAFTNLPAGASAELVIKKPGRATVCTFKPTAYSSGSFRYAGGQTDIRLVQPVESRIEGIVVRKDTGAPLAKVPLVLTDADNRPADGYDQRIESGSDGHFRVPALAAGQYKLQMTWPRTGPAQWAAGAVPVALEAGQTRADVKIEVSQGGILEVAVSEVGGNRPVAQAGVSLHIPSDNRYVSSDTNDEGIARMRLPPGVYDLQGIYKPGYVHEGQPQTVTVEEGKTQRLTMVLKETPKVRGVVRDPDGTPVAGAAIGILPGSREETTSDAQGKYEIAWNPRGWGDENMVSCLVVRDVRRNLAATVELAETMTAVDVKLEPAVILTGRIVNADGKGITNAQVRPMISISMWSTSIDRDAARSRDDGRFEVRAVPDQHKYSVYVSADGYGKKSVEADTGDAMRRVLDLGVITLPAADLSVSGRVVDPEGRPVADAMVDTYGEEQPDGLETRTDGDGGFRLDGVCAGQITLRICVGRERGELTANILTDGGASDLKIALREGQAPIQYMGARSYAQVAMGEKAIAGVAIDEKGAPVAGVPVQVCCHKRLREGRMSWMFSDFRELSATTDTQGRFAIGIEEDGEYNLLFSPEKFAAIIVYDVPIGKKDLSVTLTEGGTVVGRLLKMDKGRKVPIPSAPVKIEQTDRASFSHLGFDRDGTTVTDAEGRFRFEHLTTLMREDHRNPLFIPRSWRISFGETSETILFDKGDLIEDFELVVRSDPAKAAPLAGSRLPDFNGIKIDLSPERIKDKRVLVCFFDWEQRPSRSCVMQLAKQADALKAKGVALAAVSVSTGDDTALQAWARENQIPFPVGTIDGDKDEVLFTWSVKSLPWLILADNAHTVTAEGFNPAELTQKLEEPVAKP